MIERILELCKSINRVLLKEQNVHKYGHQILEEQEIIKLKDLCKGLREFFHSTVTISTEKYATQSKVLPIIHVIDKSVSFFF
jgi:hypothetical protein